MNARFLATTATAAAIGLTLIAEPAFAQKLVPASIHTSAPVSALIAKPDASGVIKTPDRINDFTLPDVNGKMYHLYDMKDAKAVVLIWQGVGCPIVQQMTPAIKEAAAKYGPKGVKFMMINSNIQDNPAMMKQEAEKFDITMPVLKDTDQKVGLNVGVQRTADVVVLDPKKNFKILYHGPLDDRLTYGRARAHADNNWTTDVLDATLAGKTVPVVTRPTDGCIVNFPDRDKQG